MDYMKVRTRGGGDPRGKARVYFTCHPDDFDKYFDKVCDDIFRTQDCAIYYTADMTAPIPEMYRDADLGQMNLFVMPVTFRLLHEKNRAMDSDFEYAAGEKHLIPVLPLMMETGIDEFFKNRFGERQYLSPYTHDLTAISYEEKLKKYLESILLDDKTTERIRKAFDAYIFLSYRKKDRHHANELMGLIHKNPLYRDVAIWYDEFLIPGENFNENIDKALKKSDLFAMLVTPNLVNEKNYVQTVEYPNARRAGKAILPAEMLRTDRAELKSLYPGLPDCVDAHGRELDSGVLDALKTISLRANEGDPEHCYLIGLAYLEGIDVEVNKKYAVELITAAAEKEYPEAMEKLYNMYDNGEKIQVNYGEALKWAQRLYEYYLRIDGETGENTLIWMGNVARAYGKSGDYKKSLELGEKCYTLMCKVLGKKHQDTLSLLNNLACTYGDFGDRKKALELHGECYALRCKVLGEEHPDTLNSLGNLASAYRDIGEYEKALELNKQCYALRCKVLGEEHSDTLNSLGNLASAYSDIGDYKKALELNEKCYSLMCKVLGEEHPNTLTSLNNLALAYRELGDYKKVLKLNKQCYVLSCKVLGEEHPDTLTSLSNLALAYRELGDYKEALKLNKQCYVLSCKALCEEHPNALTLLSNLAYTYGELGEHKKELDLNEQCYALYCKALGEEHPDTLRSLNNLAYIYGKLGNYKKALELHEQCYALRCKVLGEEHPDTLTSLNNLAFAYGELGDYKKALELNEKCYKLMHEVLGEEHPNTLASLNNLAFAYYNVDEYEKAEEILAKLYMIYCKVAGAENVGTQSVLFNLISVSLSSEDSNMVSVLCGAVYKSNYTLLAQLADVVAQIFDSMNEPDKAVEIRARASKN